jgi:hypothetical protein
MNSVEKPTRVVFHPVLAVTRTFGLLVIALGILGVPQMSFLTGRLAAGLGTLSSVALVLAGVAWLVGIELFLHFFDCYLSRN